MLLRDKMPDQLKMSFALWTRHAVRELIRLRYALTLTLTLTLLAQGRLAYKAMHKKLGSAHKKKRNS